MFVKKSKEGAMYEECYPFMRIRSVERKLYIFFQKTSKLLLILIDNKFSFWYYNVARQQS